MSNYTGSYFELAIPASPMGTAFTADQIYITGVGVNWYDATYTPAGGDEGLMQSFIQFQADGTGYFTSAATAVANGGSTTQYSTQLSTINLTSRGGGQYYILKVPETDSGRMYISLGQGFETFIISGEKDGKKLGLTINPYDSFDNTKSAFYTSYDKIEFTYMTPSTPSSPPYNSIGAETGIWIDTTAVDFFFLPIVLTSPSDIAVVQGTDPSKLTGGSLQTGTQHGSTVSVGINQPWATVMGDLKADLTGDWAKCVVLSGSGTGNVLLRVEAPFHCIDPANKSRQFNENYLQSYIDSVWSHYATTGNKIAVNCSELVSLNPKDCPSMTATTSTFTGTVTGDTFNFTNGVCNITIGKPTSNEVFQCNGGAFNVVNKTVSSVIIRELCVALNTGLLPIADNTAVLSATYFQANASNFYKPTPSAGLGASAPSYNLYSGVLHSYADPIYAFPFDDAAGQSSTIYIANPPASGTTAVTMSFADMTGAQLVSTNDSTQYNLVISAGAGGSGSYNGTTFGNNSAYAPITNLQLTGVTSPLALQYGYGNPPTLNPMTLNIDEQVSQPAGAVFKSTGTDSFDVALPGAPPSKGKMGFSNQHTFNVQFLVGLNGTGSITDKSGTTQTLNYFGANGHPAAPSTYAMNSPFTLEYQGTKAGSFKYTVDIANNTITPISAGAPTITPIIQVQSSKPYGATIDVSLSLPGYSK